MTACSITIPMTLSCIDLLCYYLLSKKVACKHIALFPGLRGGGEWANPPPFFKKMPHASWIPLAISEDFDLVHWLILTDHPINVHIHDVMHCQ